jgi:predicted Holliday junction resolvase-like endonuclease
MKNYTLSGYLLIMFELLLLGIIVGFILAYLWLRSRVEAEIQRRLKPEFERWIAENEQRIREETLERSRAVLKGKIAEQIAAVLPEFPYNPADARFIGNPVDYVVFNGYTEVKDEGKETPIEVILLDVKSGEGVLTREQKLIKQAIEEGKVRWCTLKL